MTFGMRGIPLHSLATTLGATAALVAVATGAAGAQTGGGHRVYGGSYASYVQCNRAGSLSVGLGLYRRFECDADAAGTHYSLWYVE